MVERPRGREAPGFVNCAVTDALNEVLSTHIFTTLELNLTDSGIRFED